MSGAVESDRPNAALRRAIGLVLEARDLIDAHGGSPEAAAMLDLALVKMRQELSGKSSRSDE